jgi:hypothetical protein
LKRDQEWIPWFAKEGLGHFSKGTEDRERNVDHRGLEERKARHHFGNFFERINLWKNEMVSLVQFAVEVPPYPPLPRDSLTALYLGTTELVGLTRRLRIGKGIHQSRGHIGHLHVTRIVRAWTTNNKQNDQKMG